MHRQSTIRRLITFGVVALIGMVTFTGVAAANPAREAAGGDDTREGSGQASSTKDCDGTHHSTTGHGANEAEPHAYTETCDGSPSGNGVGDGDAKGTPCAGCVGNADDKDPPGQHPDGPTDHNAGYECDRNQGVGKTNPAHTGCTSPPAGNSTDEDPGGDAGERTGNGSGGNGALDGAGPPACPAGDAAMTDHRFVLNGTRTVRDLTGEVQPGDHVEASFTIAASCADVEVALVSYTDGHTVSDSASGRFGPGRHALAVDVPSCAFQVDLLGPGGHVLDTDGGGSACVAASAGGSQDHDGTGPVTVVGPAVNATAGNPTHPGVDARADGVGRASAASAPARAAEVLGVQYRRAVAASLAVTGAATTLPLALVGVVLCLLGFGLSSIRPRRDTTVSVAARLTGF